MDFNSYFSTQEKKVDTVTPNMVDTDIILPPLIKSKIDYNNIINQSDENINFDKEPITDLDRKLNISKSASYGWNMGKASLAAFASAIPGTADRFRDWFFKKHGDNPVDDDWLEHAQEYLQEKSLQYNKEAELIGEPHGIKYRLIARH